MAELKISQFCSLATAPAWQTWLYNHNESLFNNYLTKLHESKGCNYNRELMVETLDKISQSGGYAQLLDFISTNYPYMVVEEYKSKSDKPIADAIFPDYIPNVLTYPRRVVFSGDPEELSKRIKKFTVDKLKHDSIIVDNRGYVEYLTEDDIGLIDQIPTHNWLIASYRKNNV